MASYNVSSTEKPIRVDNKAVTETLAEGAVMCTGADFDAVLLPAGAAATKIYGVARSAAVSGDRLSLLLEGQGNVLLAATATCTAGVPLITANASGHAKSWTNETDVDVVGMALVTRTAGASAEMVPVEVKPFRKT